jgi:predicted NBD/HSP70 family sugar kinase
MLAELSRGNARGCDDAVYLIGRIGIGAGVIVNGSPVTGRDGRAGEVGHNVVKAGGPPCHCGKRGCLETLIGDVALLKLARRDVEPTEQNVAAVFADAANGDRRALQAVRTIAEWLGQALGNLVNILNPQRIILGGSLSGVLEIARPEVEHALEQYAFDAGHPVELVPPCFGVDSALLGAAELAFTDLLDDPFFGRLPLPR